MRVARIINNFLAIFGFSVVRRKTLVHLSDRDAKKKLEFKVDYIAEIKELFKSNLSFIESRVDDIQNEFLRSQISTKWEVYDNIERLVSVREKTNCCYFCGHVGAYDKFSVFESHCIFGGGRLTRFQCPKCDVIFGAKKMLDMNAAELTQEYEAHYKVFKEGDSTELEIRAFHLLKPTKDGVYLNYGAGGWSKSTQILRSQGWCIFAYEPHDSAVSNYDYMIKSKADLLKIQFDGVFSNNVLEHIRHPLTELDFIKNILKPDALMAHATPCFEYAYEYTRFHLFFYLGRSRELLAKKLNLEIMDFVVDGDFMCLLFKNKF